MGRTFTGSHHIIVTVGTLIGSLSVVNGNQGWPPYRSGMTTITQVTGYGMGDGFKSARTNTVMAARLGASLPRHCRVIKGHA